MKSWMSLGRGLAVTALLGCGGRTELLASSVDTDGAAGTAGTREGAAGSDAGTAGTAGGSGDASGGGGAASGAPGAAGTTGGGAQGGASTCGHGPSTWSWPGAPASLPINAAGVALADVTGDGRADVVVSFFDGFAIFSEVSPGALGPSVKVAAPKGGTWDPVAVDLDGDGRAEVIRLTSYEGAFVYAHPGTPSQTVTPIAGSTGLSVLRAADMDGDGRLDLVGASSDDNKGTLRVFRGLEGGGFEALPPSKIPSSVMVTDIAVGDVDGNGTPDVVVLFSTAKGSVREAVFRDPLSASTLPEIMLDPEAPGCDYLATSIGIGDLDGDGRNDIVTTRTQQNLGTNMAQLLVRYQAKDGTMGPSDYVTYDPFGGSSYPSWFGPVIVADGDGDGRADVLATDSTVDLMLFQGPKGLGGPGKTVWHPNGGHGAYNSIVIGDIDCDGRDELVRSSSVMLTVTFGAP